MTAENQCRITAERLSQLRASIGPDDILGEVIAELDAVRAERDAKHKEAMDAREEASRAWAVLRNRDWMEGREEGSAVTAAIECMESRKKAMIERADAQVALAAATERAEKAERLGPPPIDRELLRDVAREAAILGGQLAGRRSWLLRDLDGAIDAALAARGAKCAG